jgi:hypothetical protein
MPPNMADVIIAGDPVKIGLVASLNRPGGNVTGFSLLDTQTESKRLEVATERVVARAISKNLGGCASG